MHKKHSIPLESSSTARGMIVAISPDTSWFNPFGVKCVTVQVSGTNGVIPRTYRNVPWPHGSALEQWAFGRPSVGDYVILGFKGGSSELPYVLVSYDGSAGTEKADLSQVARSVVPTKAIVTGVQTVASTVSPFLDPLLGPLDSLGSTFLKGINL